MGAFARIVSKGRRRDGSAEPKLPQGAEAALWSITEVVPDPRNHLALIRDLSGEVRVTDVEQAMIVHAYEGRMPDVPVVTSATAVEDLTALPPPPAATAPRRLKLVQRPSDVDPEAVELAAEVVVDVRDAAAPAMDPYYDLGQIAENAPLTDHLFTPSTD